MKLPLKKNLPDTMHDLQWIITSKSNWQESLRKEIYLLPSLSINYTNDDTL